jgi:hypothetical protein
MKVKVETITPAKAREMLSGNTHNRNYRQTHVNFLAGEMANGRWGLTTAVIALAPDGTLVDGQHRLLAVVQSGVTIESLVCRDAATEMQDKLDANSVRSVPDQMHLNGLAKAKEMVGAARHIASLCCSFSTPKLSTGSAQFVLAEYQRDIGRTLELLATFKPGRAQWVVGTLAFALSGDRSVASFIEAFGSGVNLRAGQPAKALRDWLVNGDSIHLGRNYKRGAVECVLNAVHNEIKGNRLTQVKSGSLGLDYFLDRKRESVVAIRKHFRAQQPFALRMAMASEAAG